MPRLAIPLSDCNAAPPKPANAPGGGMYLFVKPNGVKTWRLKYTKPSGKEGTLITPSLPFPSHDVSETKPTRE